MVNKVPAHLRYANFFNLLLGGALLASVTTLGYTFTQLGQFTPAVRPPALVRADLPEQPQGNVQTAATVASFCPFPLTPSNPACQSVATTLPATEEVRVTAAQATAYRDTPQPDTAGLQPAVSPLGDGQVLGWIYAGKNELGNVIQADTTVLAGQSYTMLSNVNVRRFPISSKSSENRKILATLYAGEQVQVLGLERNGEHLWLQIARPFSQNALNQSGQPEGT